MFTQQHTATPFQMLYVTDNHISEMEITVFHTDASTFTGT